VANDIAAFGGDTARVGVAGDDAGANFAAAVALVYRDSRPRLAAQFLIYPAIGLVGSCQSEIEKHQVSVEEQERNHYRGGARYVRGLLRQGRRFASRGQSTVACLS